MASFLIFRVLETRLGQRQTLLLNFNSDPAGLQIPAYDFNPYIGGIILSMHPEDQYGLRALRAGASGYLTKDCKASELIQGIQTRLLEKLKLQNNEQLTSYARQAN